MTNRKRGIGQIPIFFNEDEETILNSFGLLQTKIHSGYP